MSVIADGVDEVRKAVRENVRQGVDQIKIMGGGGVSSPGDKLIHPQYSLDEIDAIVTRNLATNLWHTLANVAR